MKPYRRNLLNITFALDDFASVFDRVRNENFAFLCDTISLRISLTKLGICDISISKEQFFKDSTAFIAQKGFPYLPMFNAVWALHASVCDVIFIHSVPIDHWNRNDFCLPFAGLPLSWSKACTTNGTELLGAFTTPPVTDVTSSWATAEQRCSTPWEPTLPWESDWAWPCWRCFWSWLFHG